MRLTTHITERLSDMLPTKRTLVIVAAAALVFSGACDSLTAPNFNAGDLEEIQNNPNRANIAAAVTGLTITTRSVYAEDDNDFVAMLGILGRENYVLDVADPRFVSEMLAGDLQAGSPAFGGNFWGRPYENLRVADIVLEGVEQVGPAELSDAEKSAVRGFVKTWKALDLLVIAVTRDANCDGNVGCPVTVEEDPEDLAPAVTLDELYAEIERLLDEGSSDLQAAGGSFPFQLHSGFAGFSTPASFAEFNRALAARVDVYVASLFDQPGKYSEALDALDESFMDVGGDFETGLYHAYSSGSGDVSNGLFQPSSDPNYRAHPSFRSGARLQTDGTTLDQRFLDKSRPVNPRTFQGVGSDVGFTLYQSTSAPVPVIRNEELILIAAEAHIGLGNLGAAEPFLNEVRTRSGGLPSVDLPSMTQAQAIDELLYDRRYSLWAEGGHRWIDARRYDRLDELPVDCPDADPATLITCPDTEHQVNARYPIPLDETLARGG